MRRPLAAVLATTVVPLLTVTAAVAAPTVARAAGPTVHTGRSSADAAPSCWAIKQSFPSSADGVYWLQTAALVAPQQFYCDMTTDGGGWVLIGRGRTGWTFHETGQGTAAALRTTVTGPSAFAPSTLPDKIVNELLNGARPDALADGVRVRRATTASGSTWQEVRWDLTNTATWTWELAGGESLSGITYGAQQQGCACNTMNNGLDNAFNRAILWIAAEPIMGFAFGPQVAGVTGSSSYLAPAVNSSSGAVPFSQVWLRPEIGDAQAGFTTVANTGAPAKTLSWLPQNQPQTFHWGVVGIKEVDDPDPANDAPAQALAQVGNTMFVGGKFTNVQNGAGGTQYPQAWLAAFDVQTGNWISTFHPQLDGTVFTLAAAPNGNLIVGGNFTNVNGAPDTAGLAELNPATGAVVSGFTAFVSAPRFNTARAFVRTVAIQGKWLYLGGGFNDVTGGPSLTTAVVQGVGRVAIATGAPDRTWRVPVDQTPMDVFPSTDGTRVYLAGFFHNVDNTTGIDAVAVVDTTTGALVPGMQRPQFDQPDSRYWYQYAIFEAGSDVYVGGSQHSFQEYTRNDFSFVTGHVEQFRGDFQAAGESHGVVFGGCHCFTFDYTGTGVYPPVNYAQVTTANWLNAYTPNGLLKLTDFEPQWAMASSGEGVWAVAFDSHSCVWAAGDMVRGAFKNGAFDWLGGFARFCPRDITAPTKPTNFKHQGSTLTWTPSTDNSGAAPSYEIIRNDRVIATTLMHSFTAPGSGRYFVRAIDTTGNRSASTAVLNV
jgi:hypothetical protein